MTNPVYDADRAVAAALVRVAERGRGLDLVEVGRGESSSHRIQIADRYVGQCSGDAVRHVVSPRGRA